MDPTFSGASDFTNGYQFSEEGSIFVSDPNPYAAYWNMFHQHVGVDPLGFAANTSTVEGSVTSMSMNSETDSSLEDTDVSETTKFISQILMEENLEQGPFYDSLSLQLTEKSFHDALIDNNSSLPPNQQHLNVQSPYGETTSSDSDNISNLHYNSCELNPPPLDTHVAVIGDHAFQLNSHGLLDLDSSVTKPLAQNIFSDADSVSQFRRGLEEATKFLLPAEPQVVTGVEAKQSAVGVVDEVDDLSDMFDRVLVNMEQLPLGNEHDSLESGAAKEKQQIEKTPSSDEGKAHPKKQGRKKETVDLRALLLLCAQAIHASDNRGANELLKQIRQHSSPFGDGSQRLAHYFANGLEARLVGDGSGAQLFYSTPAHKTTSADDFFKGYQIFLSCNPNRKFAHFYVNKMIKKASAKAETLHIIDFGILYGFQWPLLIKFLSERDGGPPKLRITGIEFPLPGFRPAQRIEETGRRLANYCKRFKVPFEYTAIASRNWETLRVEDLKIKSNEFVAVNCMMRFKNLLDESSEMNSPRDAVLLLIRKINPDIFAQAIINGSFSTPFFVTRFREALFHFSAILDMLDSVWSRENQWRMMNEREIVGRSSMNVIACEGFERLERPDNFLIDEDSNWMLQSWKGRILSGCTIWVPSVAISFHLNSKPNSSSSSSSRNQ